LNCAALPEQLVEDELFGHVKGAFTGADRDRDGRFKQADLGTLFIDEIGEMAGRTQAKLLRVLETMEFSPLGSADTVSVDVRVLTATNRELEAEVAAGRFREDLYYRINVVEIDLPPLRDRPGDIALLGRAFIDELNAANGRSVRRIAPDALRCLEQYAWPGNVRELRNILEQVIVLSDHDEIRLDDLPPRLQPRADATGGRGSGAGVVTPGTPLHEVEKRHILQTMDAYDGNRTRVAECLGISLRTLQRKLKEYGLTRTDA
jgi:transcriptional regulator with PAS, ATPase and Fis domain